MQQRRDTAIAGSADATSPLGDWGRRLRSEAEAAAARGESTTRAAEATLQRIAAGMTQLKPGYNPLSSSVGSILTVLLWSATLTGVALTTMAALMGRRAGERFRPDPECLRIEAFVAGRPFTAASTALDDHPGVLRADDAAGGPR